MAWARSSREELVVKWKPGCCPSFLPWRGRTIQSRPKHTHHSNVKWIHYDLEQDPWILLYLETDRRSSCWTVTVQPGQLTQKFCIHNFSCECLKYNEETEKWACGNKNVMCVTLRDCFSKLSSNTLLSYYSTMHGIILGKKLKNIHT